MVSFDNIKLREGTQYLFNVFAKKVDSNQNRVH